MWRWFLWFTVRPNWAMRKVRKKFSKTADLSIMRSGYISLLAFGLYLFVSFSLPQASTANSLSTGNFWCLNTKPTIQVINLGHRMPNPLYIRWFCQLPYAKGQNYPPPPPPPYPQSVFTEHAIDGILCKWKKIITTYVTSSSKSSGMGGRDFERKCAICLISALADYTLPL